MEKMSSLKSKSELSVTSVYKRLEEELLYLVWQVYYSFVKNVPLEAVKTLKLITNVNNPLWPTFITICVRMFPRIRSCITNL